MKTQFTTPANSKLYSDVLTLHRSIENLKSEQNQNKLSEAQLNSILMVLQKESMLEDQELKRYKEILNTFSYQEQLVVLSQMQIKVVTDLYFKMRDSYYLIDQLSIQVDGDSKVKRGEKYRGTLTLAARQSTWNALVTIGKDSFTTNEFTMPFALDTDKLGKHEVDGDYYVRHYGFQPIPFKVHYEVVE